MILNVFIEFISNCYRLPGVFKQFNCTLKNLNIGFMMSRFSALSSLVLHCENTVISPNSLVWKFCGNSSKTMRKLCLSTKFPHQEIKWNYSIFRSVIYFGNTFRKWCTISGIWMFFLNMNISWIILIGALVASVLGEANVEAGASFLGNHFCHAHMLDASL